MSGSPQAHERPRLLRFDCSLWEGELFGRLRRTAREVPGAVALEQRSQATARQFYGTGWEGQEGTLRLMVMDRGFGMLYSGTSKVACRCGGGTAVRRRDPAS